MRRSFQFQSHDNQTRINGWLWLPEESDIPVRGMIQLVHGMQEYVLRYNEFAEYLTKKGFMVVGHDHLGHGKSIISEEDYGFFAEHRGADILIKDMHTIAVTMRKRYPDLPYFMLGHSMGSFLLRRYLGIYQEPVQGAVIMGTGYQPYGTARSGALLTSLLMLVQGKRYRSRLIERIAFGSYLKRIDNPRTEKDWLTKDPAIVDQYLKEERCMFCFTLSAFHDLFKTIAVVVQKRNMTKIDHKLPLYLVSGNMDPVGDYGRGVVRTYEDYKKAGLQDVTLHLFENDRHEILNEIDREEVYSDLADWLEAHL